MKNCKNCIYCVQIKSMFGTSVDVCLLEKDLLEAVNRIEFYTKIKEVCGFHCSINKIKEKK